MAKRVLFSERTPLGYRVVVTRDRWRYVVRFKHPALAGHEADVRLCLRDPDLIRESAKDEDIHLFYRASNRGYLCVAVAGKDPRGSIYGHGILYKEHQERDGTVDKVKVCYDREGNSVTVWFDDPNKESVCEEIDDDVVLIKDRRGRVIGFERLNYRSPKQRAAAANVPIEVQLL